MDKLDILHVLKAKTVSRPNKMITYYLNAGIINPRQVVVEIWSTLQRRYGSDAQVSYELIEELRATKKLVSSFQVITFSRWKTSMACLPSFGLPLGDVQD